MKPTFSTVEGGTITVTKRGTTTERNGRTFTLLVEYSAFADAWIYEAEWVDVENDCTYMQRLVAQRQLNEKRAGQLFKLLMKWIEQDVEAGAPGASNFDG